ncbi:MAG: hypothetical protein V4654_14125 [Bdellovibrionota bacterium]
MNSESPNQKVKSCNSCKRSLPLNYYGVRQSSNDGYSPCCKDCRNFRRRLSYNAETSTEPAILPLSEHNKAFIEQLNIAPKLIDFVGIDLTTLEMVSVEQKRKSNGVIYFTIKYKNGSSRGLMFQGTHIDYIVLVVKILHIYNIRLFYPWDFISMTNWGLKDKSTYLFRL